MADRDRVVWDQFEHDPRAPLNARLRAADRDRMVVEEVLSTAYAEGRLTREELDERTEQLSSARTLGDLPPLIDDLVPALGLRTPGVPNMRAEAERRYRQQLRAATYAFLVPTLICWFVWISVLLTGHGTAFPWPVFVTLGTGVRTVQLLTSRQDTITSIERSLERRERKRLEAQQRRGLRGGRRDWRPELPWER